MSTGAGAKVFPALDSMRAVAALAVSERTRVLGR